MRMTQEVLQAAIDFHNAGISVVPASENGTKAPIGSWKQYQVTRADLDQIKDWFGGKAVGIGIVTGAVSGNLEMLEMEGRAVASGLLDEARDIADASGLGDLWKLITTGYLELTPSGGIHILYRIADEPVPGNTKLARRPGENGTVEVLCETRGEGGFVVTAPSKGATHPSGRPWVLAVGSPSLIPMLSMEERNALHSIFMALDAMPAKEVIAQAITKDSGDGKPGDDFNARANWKELLEPKGWKVVFTQGHTSYWRRPGKDTGISATTGRNDGDNLYVFTTSTEFEAEKPYSKFAAFAHMDHGGDFKAAARALRAAGYGKPRDDYSKPLLSVVRNIDDDHIETEPAPTSWLPKPLDLTGETDEPAPEFLCRDDGKKLIYAGKINALVGESESGKTWVALLAVKQALLGNHQVMYIDFEDSGKGILNRLRLMGVSDHLFTTFTYANPDEAFTLEAKIELHRALETLNPRLIVVDGVNAAMTLLGLDLVSNRDATFFSQTVLKPLTQFGAGVITIDHVTKNKESRSNYAIGAQAKRADINGASIMVQVVMPFGRGITGELTLKVAKDRPGHVRAASQEASYAGKVILDSSADGSLDIAIHSPGGDGQRLRPTHLMESISKLLEASNSPLSKNAIEKEIKGKAEWVRVACQFLIDEKFVAIENGSRNSLNLKLLKVYREAEDGQSGLKTFEMEENHDIA